MKKPDHLEPDDLPKDQKIRIQHSETKGFWLEYSYDEYSRYQNKIVNRWYRVTREYTKIHFKFWPETCWEVIYYNNIGHAIEAVERYSKDAWREEPETVRWHDSRDLSALKFL